MRRNITVPEDHEGLCYDADRAKKEGIHEEMTLHFFGREIEIDDEMFESILSSTGLGVNVGPDEEQEIDIAVEYVYRYGPATQKALA